MTARCEAVVMCLLGVAKKYHKFYCWVSQKRIEELLLQYQGMGISNRTLNRDLRWLEDRGFITRLRRIRVNREGKIVYCSTLYKFTGKLFNWLHSMGNRVKRLFSHFRLPALANHQLLQKQAFVPLVASSVEIVWTRNKDGSVIGWNPRTGELQTREGVKVDR